MIKRLAGVASHLRASLIIGVSPFLSLKFWFTSGYQPLASPLTSVLGSPVRAAVAGLVLAGLALAVFMLFEPADPRGLISVLLRFVHVLSAMLWVGLIFFVNFVQLRALQEADEPSRKSIATWIVPRVATVFRHASHLTVLSGALLLVATGYLLGSWVFASAVYVPLARTLLLAAGALGGLLMWTFVNLAIWPNLKIVLGQATGDAAAARQAVKLYARLNLVLALPVTLIMVAAAHLF